MGVLDGQLWFADGRLYARERTRFVAFRAWPEPGIWAGEDEESCRVPLHLRIGLADIELRANGGDRDAAKACTALLATLPRELGEDALRFPEHGWHLLELVWRAREALELVQSNPALAFALACRTELKTRIDGAWPDPREILRQRREEIAGWLEYPATGSAVAILGRATHEILHLRGLRTLRALMNRDDAELQKLMRHVRHINADVLEMLDDAQILAHIAPSLLEEVSFIRSAEAHVAGRIRGALEDWAAVMDGRFPLVRTLSELERVLTRIEGMQNHRRTKRVQAGRRPLPPPPIPGNDHIRALTTADELIDEGITQKNCAGDYAREVAGGGVYLYAVLQPERCTLSIVRGPGGWVVDQLRAKCNAVTRTAAVHRVVARWLTDAQR